MVNAEAEFGNRGRLFFIRIEDICSYFDNCQNGSENTDYKNGA